MGMAFGISEEDVSTVLQNNHKRLVTSDVVGQVKSIDSLAAVLFDRIDDGAVERAALKGGVDMDDQTNAAHEEIERQLVELGVLKPAVASRPSGP